jgi:hypothetical protein
MAAQPVFTLRELPDVELVRIHRNGKVIDVRGPRGDKTTLGVSPKTWILKAEEEGSYADLQIGQRLRVNVIPRAMRAVAVQILH